MSHGIQNNANDVEQLLGGTKLSNTSHKEALRAQLFGGRQLLGADDLEGVSGGVAVENTYARIDRFLESVKGRGVSKQLAISMITDTWCSPQFSTEGAGEECRTLEQYVEDSWDRIR